MGLVSSDDGWRLPEWLWERVEPLLPAPPEQAASRQVVYEAERVILA